MYVNETLIFSGNALYSTFCACARNVLETPRSKLAAIGRDMIPAIIVAKPRVKRAALMCSGARVVSSVTTKTAMFLSAQFVGEVAARSWDRVLNLTLVVQRTAGGSRAHLILFDLFFLKI